jgi:hypothetical protein
VTSSPNEVQGIAVIKDGSTLNHAPDRKPIWTMKRVGINFWLTPYYQASQLSLVIRDEIASRDEEGYNSMQATLQVGSTIIARGDCSYPINTVSPHPLFK